MNPHKILTVKNISFYETTKLIDSFLKRNEGIEVYDKLMLEDSFTLTIDEKLLHVHLYVEKELQKSNLGSNFGITFTHYKQHIAGHQFDAFTSNMNSLAEIVCMSLSKHKKELKKNGFDFMCEFPIKPLLLAQDTYKHTKHKYGDTYQFYFSGARITSFHLGEFFSSTYVSHKKFNPQKVTSIKDICTTSKSTIIRRLTSRDADTLFIKNAFALKISVRNKIYVSLYLQVTTGTDYNCSDYDFEDYKTILFGRTFDINSTVAAIPKSIYNLLINPKVDIKRNDLDWTCETWDKIIIPLDKKKSIDLVIQAIQFTSTPL